MNSIREQLAAEAAEAEARKDEDPGRMHRARTQTTTSNVYTVRMPADRIEELRSLAAQRGEQPSTLMRRWVLERLDAERDHEPDLTDVRRTLRDALTTLDNIDHHRTAS